MFVTTQGEYSLRCMMALASEEDRAMTLRQLAEKEELSKHYVGKLLHRLKNAGLVRPIHGSRGGYRLSKPAAEISVKDVYMASEGNAFKVFRLQTDFRAEERRRTGKCSLHEIWRHAHEAAFGVMEKMTLKTLARSSQGAKSAETKIKAEAIVEN